MSYACAYYLSELFINSDVRGEFRFNCHLWNKSYTIKQIGNTLRSYGASLYLDVFPIEIYNKMKYHFFVSPYKLLPNGVISWSVNYWSLVMSWNPTGAYIFFYFKLFKLFKTYFWPNNVIKTWKFLTSESILIIMNFYPR